MYKFKIFLFYLVILSSNIAFAKGVSAINREDPKIKHEQLIEIRKLCKEEFNNLKKIREESYKENLPIYSWAIYLQAIPNEDLRRWASTKNYGNTSMAFLKQDINILESNLYFHDVCENDAANSLNGYGKVYTMNNGLGQGVKDQCELENFNQVLYLLNQYTPSTDKIVVDIGSGWGACSKLLALLGYRVYSVDVDDSHIEEQKKCFCDAVLTRSFLNLYWKYTNPKLLDQKYFQEHCKESQKNIQYIVGDFANPETIKKISEKNWDIVLTHNSIHFMDEEARDRVFKTIKEKLSREGSLILRMKHACSITGVDCYDFKLEEAYDKYFENYYILGLIQDIENRLSGFTIMKP